jgi:hypothetical protein
LVERKVQGRHIVYAVNVPQTRLDMRKAFRNELNDLLWVYWDCLDKETRELLTKVDKALMKSITQPTPNADLRIIEETIPIPAGKKRVRVKQDLTNLYDETEEG